jgi:excisionase family DNA binding protein
MKPESTPSRDSSTGRAASELHVSPSHVRALCQAGKIAARATHGGRWRIPKGEVERLRREGVPDPPPATPTGPVVDPNPRMSRHVIAPLFDDSVRAVHSCPPTISSESLIGSHSLVSDTYVAVHALQVIEPVAGWTMVASFLNLRFLPGIPSITVRRLGNRLFKMELVACRISHFAGDRQPDNILGKVASANLEVRIHLAEIVAVADEYKSTLGRERQCAADFVRGCEAVQPSGAFNVYRFHERASIARIAILGKPGATLDASEFPVCSIVLTFVFSIFCTCCLANPSVWSALFKVERGVFSFALTL